MQRYVRGALSKELYHTGDREADIVMDRLLYHLIIYIEPSPVLVQLETPG
jgi:hypothetical protein